MKRRTRTTQIMCLWHLAMGSRHLRRRFVVYRSDNLRSKIYFTNITMYALPKTQVLQAIWYVCPQLCYLMHKFRPHLISSSGRCLIAIECFRGNKIVLHTRQTLYFEGLVVDNLDVDILAGIPFMEYTDKSVRPAKRQLVLEDIAITHKVPIYH